MVILGPVQHEISEDVRIDMALQFVEYHGIASHLLESYNHAINEGIQNELDKCCDLEYRTTNDHQRLVFGKIKVNKPVYNGKPLFPMDARIIGVPYNTEVEIQVTYQHLDPETLEVIRSSKTTYQPFCHIFVMYGSELCYTYGMNEEELTSIQESPTDIPGYYISNGLEKQPVTEKRINYNIVNTCFAEEAKKLMNIASSKKDACLFLSNKSDATGMQKEMAFVLPERNDPIRFFFYPFTKNNNPSPIEIVYMFDLLQVDRETMRRLISLPQVLLDRMNGEQTQEYYNIIDINVNSEGMSNLTKNQLVDLSRVHNDPDELSLDLSDEQRRENLIKAVKKSLSKKTDDQSAITDEQVVKQLIENVFITLGPDVRKSDISLRDDLVFYIAYLVQQLIWFKINSMDNSSIYSNDYTVGSLEQFRFEAPGLTLQEEIARLHKVTMREVTSSLKKSMGNATSKNQTFDLLQKWKSMFDYRSKSITTYVNQGRLEVSRNSKGKTYTRDNLVESRRTGNHVDIQAMARKVTKVSASHANTDLLDVNQSEKFFMDPDDTPENEKIRLNTNLAIHTRITLKQERDLVQDMINRYTNITNIMIAKIDDIHNVPIFLNGILIGYTDDYKTFLSQVRQRKRDRYLSEEISCFLDDNRFVIQIYCDGGRLMIPVFTRKAWDGNLPESYSDCLEQSYIEFVDMHEFLYKQYIDYQPSEQDDEDYSIYEVDPSLPYGSNASDYELDLSEVSGMILHPSLMYGVSLQHIPFANHNLSQRLLITAQQNRVMTGQINDNVPCRIDNKILYSPKSCMPISIPKMKLALNAHKNPQGNMVMMAILPLGSTMEDGIVMNKKTMTGPNAKIFTIVRESVRIPTTWKPSKNEEVPYIYGKMPSEAIINNKNNRYDYSDLDNDGSMKIGTVVKSNSCLFVRSIERNKEVPSVTRSTSSIRTTMNKKVIEIEEIDKSLYNGEEINDYTGYTLLSKIKYINKTTGVLKVVFVFTIRQEPQLGTKFTSDHGQKGTAASFRDEEDLFCTLDGVYPDVFVSPCYIPSRMTVSQPLEGAMNLKGLVEGRFIDATAHTTTSKTAVSSVLDKYSCEVDMTNKYGDIIRGIQFMPIHYAMLNKIIKYEESVINKTIPGQKNLGKNNSKSAKGKKTDHMAIDIFNNQGSTKILENICKSEADSYLLPVDNESHTIKQSSGMTQLDTTKAFVNFQHLVAAMNISMEIE